MTRDLLLAILSMDSYNRGYGVGISGLSENSSLGNANTISRELIGIDNAQFQSWQEAGFYAIATAQPKDDAEDKASASLAGIAIWASVNDEVDAKIREQIKSGAFPIRLHANDWASGDVIWLLDILALNKGAASSVLASFAKIARDRPVNIHPIVSRSVDTKFLERLKRSDAAKDALS